MDFQKAFYLCKAEVEQRHRDIHRAIEEARKTTDSPKVWDNLASIFHHSDMAVDSFKKIEKEIERENDAMSESMGDLTIFEQIDRIKREAEKIVKGVI